jgi:hypothetical protein
VFDESSGADVIAWLIALVELRLGYSSSEYAWAAFWYDSESEPIIMNFQVLSSY